MQHYASAVFASSHVRLAQVSVRPTGLNVGSNDA